LVFTAIGAGVVIGNSVMSLSYHTYQSELFPTQIRALGVGLVYSFSRLSAIFSGYIVAFTLGAAGSAGVFALSSLAMVIVALNVGIFGPCTRGLRLKTYSGCWSRLCIQQCGANAPRTSQSVPKPNPTGGNAQAEAALRVIDTALVRSGLNGPTRETPDLLRTRGEILLALPKSDADAAEKAPVQSFEPARGQGALG
jgi:hypothetical protein